MIDILRSLKETGSSLEDRKGATFFKVTDDISKLGGPPLVRDSTLITAEIWQLRCPS